MHDCGYAEGLLHDRSRSDWDGAGPRPVRWAAWYPAASGGGSGEPTSDDTDAPLFESGPLVPDAAPARNDAPWPVILLSHGTGGAAQGLGWLAHRLTSHGWFCLGVSHHGNTAVEPYRAEGFLCWWERAADLSFALDRLDDIVPSGARVDPSRIAVVGFSLGGYTALTLLGATSSLDRFERWRVTAGGGADGPREFPDLGAHAAGLARDSAIYRESLARHDASYDDPRIRAAVALAPAPTVRAFEPDSVAAIGRPVLLAGGEADAEAPFGPCIGWLHECNAAFETLSLGPDVGHYVFLPECTARGRSLEPVLCTDAPGVQRRAVHDRVAERARVFLDGALGDGARS